MTIDTESENVQEKKVLEPKVNSTFLSRFGTKTYVSLAFVTGFVVGLYTGHAIKK